MKRILLILTLIVTFTFQANAQGYIKPPIKSKELMKWITTIPDMDTAVYGATAFEVNKQPWFTLGDTASLQYSKPKHRKSTLRPIGGVMANDSSVNFVGRKRIGAFSFKLNQKVYIGGGRFVGDSAMIDSVYGGRVFDSTLCDVWMFNPSSNVWTQRADVVNRHAVRPNPIPGNSVNLFDTFGRAYPVSFVLNGIAHVGHGYSKKYIGIDSLEWKMSVYPTTFPDVDPSVYPSIPLPPHLFKIGKKVLDPAFVQTRLYNDMFTYDTLSNKWNYINSNANLNTAARGRGRFGCISFVTYNGKDSAAYIGLGSDSSGMYNEFFTYTRFGFTPATPLPYTPRNYAHATAWGNYGYVTCGYDGLAQRDFYEYSAETKQWERFRDFPDTGRYQMADVRIDSAWYFFGGREATDNTSKEIYVVVLDTNKIRITNVFDADSTFCTLDTIEVAYKGFFDTLTYDPTDSLYKQDSSFRPNNYMVLEAVYFNPITLTNEFYVIDSVAHTPFSDTIKFVYRKSIADGKYSLSVRANQPLIPGHITIGKYKMQQTPEIIDQPDAILVDIHKKAKYFVGAVGTNIKYQWYKDDVKLNNDSTLYFDTVSQTMKYFFHIKGAESEFLEFDSVSLSDTGFYYVVVSGECSPPDTSQKVILKVVNTPTPMIVKQPVDTSVCQNTEGKLHVDVISLTANYLWVKLDTIILPNDNSYDTTIRRDTIRNGGNFTGANTKTLTFRQTRQQDTGYYYVYIYESTGADTISAIVKLSISKIPNILTQPELFIKKHAFENTSFWIKADGDSLTYQWYKDNIKLVDGPIYSGVETDSLSITNLTLNESGFYYCLVTSKCGDIVQTGYGLLEVDPFPLITTQPVNPASACEGEDLTLFVQAQGANLKFQWYKINGSDTDEIVGASQRTFTIFNISPIDNGRYICKVSSDSIHYVYSQTSNVRSKDIPTKPILETSNCASIRVKADSTLNCTQKETRWYFNGVYDANFGKGDVILVGKRVGQFQVMVICDGCYSEKSDPIFCNTLGIEKTSIGSLNVYPNPVHFGNITIEIPENLSGNIALKLYDISGRLVWNGNADASDKYTTIDMSNLAAGMYQVQLINDDKIFTSKVIVD